MVRSQTGPSLTLADTVEVSRVSGGFCPAELCSRTLVSKRSRSHCTWNLTQRLGLSQETDAKTRPHPDVLVT